MPRIGGGSLSLWVRITCRYNEATRSGRIRPAIRLVRLLCSLLAGGCSAGQGAQLLTLKLDKLLLPVHLYDQGHHKHEERRGRDPERLARRLCQLPSSVARLAQGLGRGAQCAVLVSGHGLLFVPERRDAHDYKALTRPRRTLWILSKL